MIQDKKPWTKSRAKNRDRRATLWSFLFGSTSSPGVCFWCERHLYFDRSTFDHVPPLSKGGHASRGVISCYSCNRERKNKYDPLRDKVPDYLLAMGEEEDEMRSIKEGMKKVRKEAPALRDESSGRAALRRLDKLWETSPPYLPHSSSSTDR